MRGRKYGSSQVLCKVWYSVAESLPEMRKADVRYGALLPGMRA